MPLSSCASCDCRVPPRADPLGIPTVFYFLLSHQRSSIDPPIDKNLEEQRGTQHAVVSTPVEPLRPNCHKYIRSNKRVFYDSTVALVWQPLYSG